LQSKLFSLLWKIYKYVFVKKLWWSFLFPRNPINSVGVAPSCGCGEGLWCGELNRPLSSEYAPDIDAVSASGAYSAGNLSWVEIDSIQTAPDVCAMIAFTHKAHTRFAVRYTSKNLSAIDAISEHIPPPWL